MYLVYTDVTGPQIFCGHCTCGDFIRHENEPGKPTAIECTACRIRFTINFVGFVSALRHASEEDLG